MEASIYDTKKRKQAIEAFNALWDALMDDEITEGTLDSSKDCGLSVQNGYILGGDSSCTSLEAFVGDQMDEMKEALVSFIENSNREMDCARAAWHLLAEGIAETDSGNWELAKGRFGEFSAHEIADAMEKFFPGVLLDDPEGPENFCDKETGLSLDIGTDFYTGGDFFDEKDDDEDEEYVSIGSEFAKMVYDLAVDETANRRPAWDWTAFLRAKALFAGKMAAA